MCDDSTTRGGSGSSSGIPQCVQCLRGWICAQFGIGGGRRRRIPPPAGKADESGRHANPRRPRTHIARSGSHVTTHASSLEAHGGSEEGAFVLTFRDIPEAITWSNALDEARSMAA